MFQQKFLTKINFLFEFSNKKFNIQKKIKLNFLILLRKKVKLNFLILLRKKNKIELFNFVTKKIKLNNLIVLRKK